MKQRGQTSVSIQQADVPPAPPSQVVFPVVVLASINLLGPPREPVEAHSRRLRF